MLIDLGAGIGGLTGAAIASPLVFGEGIGATRNRLWLSSIALGTITGATVGLLATAAHGSDRRKSGGVFLAPALGIVDAAKDPDGTVHPITGVGIRGAF
jgi:hypothetical protein